MCATAPSSVVLILGRAIAGLGATGLFSGALVIIAHSIPLRLRPCKPLLPDLYRQVELTSVSVYTGVIASMFGVANIVGPVLGGALTQHVSWRWCMFIRIRITADS